MSAHNHTVITPGCYRCDLNIDEVRAAEQDEADQTAREAACPGHSWEKRESQWSTWWVCRLCRGEVEL